MTPIYILCIFVGLARANTILSNTTGMTQSPDTAPSNPTKMTQGPDTTPSSPTEMTEMFTSMPEKETTDQTLIYDNFFFRDEADIAPYVTEGEQWITFQRRVDDSIDFFRGWDDYERGFGTVDGSFWIGLENLYTLAKEPTELLIVMKEFNGSVFYAKYDHFQLGGPETKYRLNITGYSGNANHDDMSPTNGMKFTTKDRDNDLRRINCAQRFKGGWWYNACHRANLNGIYYNGTHTSYADGINWYHKTTYYRSLMKTIMLVKKH